MLRIGQAHKQAPPVVNETNATGEQPAALQVLRRETTPAPVVLQFIKSILAIRPVTIQLAQSQNLADQRGVAYCLTGTGARSDAEGTAEVPPKVGSSCLQFRRVSLVEFERLE